MKRKVWIPVFSIVCVSALLCACGTYKKKKFLDYFQAFRLDSLQISSASNAGFYLDPNINPDVRGTTIDSVYWEKLFLDGTEDMDEFFPNGIEQGPLAYYKIRLTNAGYYLIIIRSAGMYWNSRFYACIYNSGEEQIESAVLIADYLSYARGKFICASVLKKEDHNWSISIHEYYQEPFDYYQHQVDSFQVREINTVISTLWVDDRYEFEQKSKQENSYVGR